MSAHAVVQTRIWDVSPEAQELKKLIDQSRYYPSIFQQAIGRIPNAPSRFLRALKLKKAADKLEMNRAPKMLDYISKMEKDAKKTLATIYQLATDSYKRATGENRRAVGDITVLRNQLELCIKARRYAFTEYSDTIALVQKHLNVVLPVNHLDWTRVQFGFYSGEGLSIEERVHHQERWNYVIDKIKKEDEILTELKIAESTMRDFSLIQALCQHLISSAGQEEKVLVYRFRMLKNALALGELAKLSGFFELRVNGGSSLNQFKDDIDGLEERFLLEAQVEDQP